MSAMPPPPPSMGPPPGYQPYGGPSGQVPTSLGKATAALVCGIVGILFCPIVLSVLAIVFGTQAKGQIDRNPGLYTNRSQARAGFILGIVGLALMPVWVVMVSR